MATSSEAGIRYGVTGGIRNIGDHGIHALYKRYDYKHDFRKFPEVDEAGKYEADIFIRTLRGIKRLERGKILGKNHGDAVAVHSGIEIYLKDVKGEVLEKFSNAARVIRRNAKPEEVKKAIEDLKWYQQLVEERTDEDFRIYEKLMTGQPHVPGV